MTRTVDDCSVGAAQRRETEREIEREDAIEKREDIKDRDERISSPS